jgi:hypothetical protein
MSRLVEKAARVNVKVVAFTRCRCCRECALVVLVTFARLKRCCCCCSCSWLPSSFTVGTFGRRRGLNGSADFWHSFSVRRKAHVVVVVVVTCGGTGCAMLFAGRCLLTLSLLKGVLFWLVG